MPERPPHPSPDHEPRRLFDLATIAELPVDDLEVSQDAQDIADAYLASLKKESTQEASMAETAWALRRSLQRKLMGIRQAGEPSGDENQDVAFNKGFTNRLRRKFFKEDLDAGVSLALYRKLLSLTQGTFERELARHESEKKDINGTYEEFKSLEKSLQAQRDKLNKLLTEMFKRAGKEPEPVHLVRRTVLEARVQELEDNLTLVKQKNPSVAALIEYDTVVEYARQLREQGFIWTKSRQKLLQDVLTGALTSRPVAALMGETGSGKTAMARAASLELSSREPERTVGGDQEKFVRLLASPAIEEGKTYYEYGPLLRAMTGLSSSTQDFKESKGGGIFFDDEFNTRPTSVQRQILKFVAEARAGRKVAVPGTPLTVEVQPGFLYLAAGNPPSERYDREETGIETKREFAGNVLNVEYLEQTPDNPELYQVLLASLLDQQTGRLTAVTPGELEPAWRRDKTTGDSSLDFDPTHGAFLWRFSQAWGQLFRAFGKQDTVLHKKHPGDPPGKYHLPSFILDPGVVISWMDQYKASPRDRKTHLAAYLTGKLTSYSSQFPQDEQATVRSILTHFGIPKTQEVEGEEVVSGKTKKKKVFKTAEVDKPPATVLTPRDIGFLNPNVPRPKQEPAPKKFEGRVKIDPETGEAIGTEPIPEPEPGEPKESASLQEARDILGSDNVLGPEALHATWDLDLAPEDIPEVPYSREQLEGAKLLGMMLILRIDKDNGGRPLTGERMNEILKPQLQTQGKGKLLYNVDWYPNEPFYKDATPKFEWKLVTRELLPNSTNLDYADQTKLLRDTLAVQPDLTQAEQDAITQADDATLARLKTQATQDATWKQAAQELANLALNRNHRRSFADTLFDHASLLQTQGTRLFNGQVLYDWTSGQSSDGRLVRVGSAVAVGVRVGAWKPRNRSDDIGVSLSR